MPTDGPSTRELDAFRDARRPLHRRARRGVLPPFRGPEGDARGRADLRAHEELTKLETAQRLRGRADRAVALRLRGLSRQPDPRATRRASRAWRPRSRRRSTARRSPTGCCGSRCRTSPTATARERLEETRLRLLDEHLNPVYLEAARDRPRGGRAARRAELLRALQELRLPAGRARRRMPRRCSTRPRSSGSARATGSSARGSASASPSAAVGRAAPLPRARARSALSRPTGWCPRSRRRSPTSASTCARRRTSHLDLERRPNKSPRRVLRADRGAGPRDARDPADRRQGRLGGALPRGRPHRALRAHVAATRRSRRGASATWRSPRAGRRCSSISSPSPRG